MVPDSLRFEANPPGTFTDRGKRNELSMYLATSVRSGQSLTFSLSAADRVVGGETATTSATPMGLSLARTVGQTQPVQQLAPFSPGKRFLSWTILICALVTAAILMVLAFRRVTGAPAELGGQAAQRTVTIPYV